MYCKNCGTQIEDNSSVCPKCGEHIIRTDYPGQATIAKPKAPNSISGFVCSIVGLFIPFVGFILCIIGIVLSCKGKKAVTRNPEAYSGTGFLTAGLVIGIVGLVFSLITIFYFILAGAILGGTAMTFMNL